MSKTPPPPRRTFVPWPGLARLWCEGSFVGLGWALALASLLHFAVLSTFVWPEWIPYPIMSAVWIGIVVICGLAWVAGWMGFTHSTDKNLGSDLRNDLFRQAQREYLRGNWFRAETALEQLLATDRVGVLARLMLATLCRHIGRIDEARQHLSILEELPDGGRWQLEVTRERRLLAKSGGSDQSADNEQRNTIE